MDIRLIAMDLDGTLLDREKNLTPENRWALERAASLGIHIVPATGRFFEAMPECIKGLPFVRYAITINGACVVDHMEDKSIYEADISLERGLQLLDHCASLGIAYDCYAGRKGYMEKYYIDHIEDYLDSPVYCRTVREMRIPVQDLRAFIRQNGQSIQKIQMFTTDRELLQKECAYIIENCPDMIATSSLKNNLEINIRSATKGRALNALADHLGLEMNQVMAFGDGGNDFDMIEAAGIGIAMANGVKELKKNADLVTLTCDGSGVAYAINKLLF